MASQTGEGVIGKGILGGVKVAAARKKKEGGEVLGQIAGKSGKKDAQRKKR